MAYFPMFVDITGQKCLIIGGGRVALRKVQVSVTDTTGFQSVITTDIIITIPTVDFLGTNADVSDYGLIANGGLYIVGGSSGCEINGNVYAVTTIEKNAFNFGSEITSVSIPNTVSTIGAYAFYSC